MKDTNFGLLVVDWDKKSVTFSGMDSGEEWTPQRTLEAAAEAEKTLGDGKVLLLAYWHDNGQLCAHDVGGFRSEFVG